MAAPNLDEKSARVRNLLSSYYGAESMAESPASSKSTTSSTAFKAPKSLGLDSTAFDVDRYSVLNLPQKNKSEFYKHMIPRAGLPTRVSAWHFESAISLHMDRARVKGFQGI